MWSELCWAAFFSFGFYFLMQITAAIQEEFKWSTEDSRKMMHLAGGLLSLIPVFLISRLWIYLLLLLAVSILLYVTWQKKLFPSIHQVSRPSIGSIIIPLPYILCFIIMHFKGSGLFYFLPLLIMVLSDPLAFYVGRKFGSPPLWPHSTKSVAGSLAFFVSSFAISCLLLNIYHVPLDQLIVGATGIGIATTAAEAVSRGGWDNLWIPVSSVMVLFAMGF